LVTIVFHDPHLGDMYTQSLGTQVRAISQPAHGGRLRIDVDRAMR